MGLLDWFSKEATEKRQKAAALKRLTEMYYQTQERQGAAHDMAAMASRGDREAVEILLRRFEFIAPNHFIDQEEKELVRELLVECGAQVIPILQTYIRRTGHPILWPFRVLQRLQTGAECRAFLVALLDGMDNDYWRDPQKKINAVQLATEMEEPEVARALVKFVDDHHEEVRTAAVGALLSFGPDEVARPALSARLATEESVRLRQQLSAGFAARGWPAG
jgi:HEAT repeat protein